VSTFFGYRKPVATFVAGVYFYCRWPFLSTPAPVPTFVGPASTFVGPVSILLGLATFCIDSVDDLEMIAGMHAHAGFGTAVLSMFSASDTN